MINKTIEIVDSEQLGELKLKSLVGRTGIIIQALDSFRRRNPGYIVKLDEPFEGECEWFIPKDSIKTL